MPLSAPPAGPADVSAWATLNFGAAFLICFFAIFFTFDLLTPLLRVEVPATAEPTSASESATTATTIAGEGVRTNLLM